jgi:hypothetical protein
MLGIMRSKKSLVDVQVQVSQTHTWHCLWTAVTQSTPELHSGALKGLLNWRLMKDKPMIMHHKTMLMSNKPMSQS